MSAIRVLLADDQPLVRQGFRMVLSAQEGIEVVGEAGDGRRALEQTLALRPDVVLMDVRMPVVDGIAATRRIVSEAPDSRVLILTTYDIDEYAFSGLRAGASGFLLKDVLPEELVAGIRTVAGGDAVVAPRVTRRLLDVFAAQLPGGTTPRPDVLASLTGREREVFQEIAAGSSNAEIARTLHLSDATVKTHVGRILAKLGLRDRVQAVILAYDHGIASPLQRP
ncbi:DNA-binding NarL/FixJ family response regulator [Motilibacter peucedani]|uniref:DNA-binding NarL/FixJ family response regulator n=1 Tax=Motilibacter peucedani TaxID=598650 RepID=A0A420XTS8_9ACTN|nr:response regulator transcription factor [Motilibacter peucedani]RKS80059.1 DNA-binding NarL/FixJ family response regulator [Motilibacter peucedani]